MIGRFSSVEIKDLAFSVLFIGIIFAYPNINIYTILVALIGVGSGFIFHELMHKFVAQHYGAISEYRAWYEGLIIGLILKIILGTTFIAPGAVYIYKDYLTKKENGIIALSGPLTNVVLAFIFYIIALVSNNSLLYFIGNFGFMINLYLAGFNMLPIPPFDGYKVITWNPLIWAVVGVPLIAYVLLNIF